MIRRLFPRLPLLALLVASPALAQDGVRLTQGSDPSADLGGKRVAYELGGTLFLLDIKKGITTNVGSGVDDLQLSPGGKAVVYSSDANPLGTNADGNTEIFHYDVKSAVTNQLTVTSDTFDCCWEPTVDKKGARVAFMSNANFVGTNADESEEVFFWNAKDDSITQVTVTTDSFTNEDARIDAGGKFVYFSSDANFVGTNADGNREIFRYDVKNGVIEQLTNTTNGDSSSPVPNKNSKFVVFETDSTDLLGANADGNEEIVRLDVKKGTVLRLTDFSFASSDPAIAGNGKAVAFEATGNPLGTNADGSNEIFLVWIQRDTLALSQITDGTAADSSGDANLETSGKRIIFASDADLTGQGAGTDHVFQFETR